MFGLSPAHLVIILVIALVVIGPGKLPEVGAAIGKSIREFQKAAGQITEPTQAPAPTPPAQPAQPVQPMQPMQPMPPAQSYYASQPVYGAPAYPQQPPPYGAPVYPAQPMPADPAVATSVAPHPETVATDLPAAGPKVDWP